MNETPPSFFWLDDPSFRQSVEDDKNASPNKDLYFLSACFAVRKGRVDIFEKVWSEMNQNQDLLCKEIANMLGEFVYFNTPQIKMIDYMLGNQKKGLDFGKEQVLLLFNRLHVSDFLQDQATHLLHRLYLSLSEKSQRELMDHIGQADENQWVRLPHFLEKLAQCCHPKDQKHLANIWQKKIKNTPSLHTSDFPFMRSLAEKQKMQQLIRTPKTTAPSKRM